MILNNVIDFLFLVDIIVIFNTAIYDQYFQIIEDRKKIALIYLKGWFTIDALAILPFDWILSAGGGNAMVRFARIGRLYRLVKLTRLLRVFKIMKDKNKFMKLFSDLLKLGPGFERLFFIMLLMFVLIHITSCIWVMFPSFTYEPIKDGKKGIYYGTWIQKYQEKENLTGLELYATSLYWTCTTITTVGYGDIVGNNTQERIFCSIIMIIGVIAFSFVNGSLTSILSNFDQQNAAL